MNIKSVVNSFLPFDVRKTENAGAKKDIKSQESHDRDADGRRQPDQEPNKRHLSEEELKDAVKYLEELPGVKDNNLVVRLRNSESEVRVVYIEDRKGQVVRRIPEAELWQLTLNRQKKKGQLLDKAM